MLVARIPGDEPLSLPWSRCTVCRAPQRASQYVPVSGVFANGGECASCGTPGGLLWFWLHAANGLLWVLVGCRFGVSWELLPYLVGFSGLLALAVIDLGTYRLPDRLTFPLLYATIGFVVVAALAGGHPDRLLGAAIGGLLYWGVMALMGIVSPKGMGWGDVKLARILGVLLGYVNPLLIIYALLFAGALGVLTGGLLLAVRRRNAPFPFGPWLVVGCFLAVLLSNQLIP
jgi:leader peptidase (prepilin peptidase)/N-methyltransferase